MRRESGVMMPSRKRLNSSASLSPLLITSEILEYIESEAVKAPEVETGGIIAGRGDVSTGDVCITHASDAGPLARRSRYRFARDTEHCQKLLDRWVVESGGTIDYLGEWHKHHESDPTPSPQDILTCRRIAASSNYHVTTVVLLIIGASDSRNSLHAYSVDCCGRTNRLQWSELSQQV